MFILHMRNITAQHALSQERIEIMGKLLKPNEVAQQLGIGRSLTYELIAQGKIPHIRLGRCIRVSEQSLQEWLKSSELGTVMSQTESPLDEPVRHNASCASARRA
jgi:excisionase family DNA binding protein